MSFRSAIRRWYAGDGTDSDRSNVTEELIQEQHALADEIERLFRVFHERLETLAHQARELSSNEFAHGADLLRAEQDSLRRALRRLDATARSTRELEQELDEWTFREENGALHADHPSVRMEIVASELVTRGAERPPRPTHEDADDNAILFVTEEDGRGSPPQKIISETYEPLPIVDVGHLLSAIRDATRETERWHAVPDEALDDDALVQVHYVRELHAILKRLDRRHGIVRDRVALAVNSREVH